MNLHKKYMSHCKFNSENYFGGTNNWYYVVYKGTPIQILTVYNVEKNMLKTIFNSNLYFQLPLEEKFRISVQPRNILYTS